MIQKKKIVGWELSWQFLFESEVFTDDFSFLWLGILSVDSIPGDWLWRVPFWYLPPCTPFQTKLSDFLRAGLARRFFIKLGIIYWFLSSLGFILDSSVWLSRSFLFCFDSLLTIFSWNDMVHSFWFLRSCSKFNWWLPIVFCLFLPF